KSRVIEALQSRINIAGEMCVDTVAKAQSGNAQPSPSRPPNPLLRPAPEIVGTSSYMVQVASQRTEADAQASFKALQQRYPSVLGNSQVTIQRADFGDKGIYYRAQIGPFATAEQAQEMCSKLLAAGGQCIVQRN